MSRNLSALKQGSGTVQHFLFLDAIVRQHLGDHAVQICGDLVRRPRRTLKELQANLGLPMGQLRNCLLVLIQHNLVTATTDSSKGREFRYNFEVEESLLRIRYPKFCSHLHSVHGEDAEMIMQAVLDAGRATWAQIRSFCQDAGAKTNEDKLLEVGDRLVAEKYITRVVVTSDKASERAPEQQTTTGKRKGEPSEAKSNKLRRLGDGGPAPSNDDGDGGPPLAESLKNEGSLWRFNPAAFMWDFRGTAVQHMIADRYGLDSATTMNLLIKAARGNALQPRNVEVGHFPELTVDEMLGVDDATIVRPTWEQVADELKSRNEDHGFQIVTKRKNPDKTLCYQLDLHLATQTLVQRIIEEVIEKKFEAKGRRIFRLLCERKYLESKVVWDLSMVPKKDANDLLCRMLKAQYIRMQEVPRTTDHNAQRTFFLWFVDMDRVGRLVQDEMLRTMWVLLTKREEKKRECDDFVGVGGEVTDLTPAQHKEFQALEHQVERLTTAILRLDETIMVLRDGAHQERLFNQRTKVHESPND